MENINFLITDVIRAFKRQNVVGWHVENISYKKAYTMALVLDGNAEYRIGAQTYSVQKNDLIIFSPQTTRSGKASPDLPWSFTTVLFHMDLNEEAEKLFHKSILIYSNTGDAYRKLFAEVHRTWISKDPLYQVKCKMLVTEILYKVFVSDLPYQNVSHIEKLEQARMTIQENFRNDLSVEALASSVGISVSYFRRLFQEVYGCPPMQYIINLRIEHARDLLLSQEVNVTEAAHLSGFNDIYYFSRLFKKKTGLTPSALLGHAAGYVAR